MGKVLFDKAPLVIDTVLATNIGLNEAIVLQQVHYWVEVNKAKQSNYFDGYYWTYNSMKEWNKSFPFFGEKTLKRIFNNLEKLKILKTGNFNKLRMDRTKWYTIDYEALDTYINTIEESIADEEAPDEVKCPEEVDTDEQNDSMQYPEWENARGQNDPMQEDNLTQCKGTKWPNAKGQNDPTNTRDYTEINSEINSETSSSSLKDVVEFFQNNFYLLKAFEAEILSDWVKRYPPNLVLEAMKVARKNNVRNLTYIERVLINWDQEGITSIKALQGYLKSREENKSGQNRPNIKDANEPDQYSGLELNMSDLQ